MPSLRARLKKLVYQGVLSEKDLERIVILPYECDPEKNVNCRKDICIVNGGECHLTYNKEFSKEVQNERETEGKTL